MAATGNVRWWHFTATGLLGALMASAGIYLAGARDWTTRNEVNDLIEKRSQMDRERITDELRFISDNLSEMKADQKERWSQLSSQMERVQTTISGINIHATAAKQSESTDHQ